jgi:hypothetical protein
MGTPPELKLGWAREALEGIADEATQRISWFGLDPGCVKTLAAGQGKQW